MTRVVDAPEWVLERSKPPEARPVTAELQTVDVDVLPQDVQRVFALEVDDRSAHTYRLVATCVDAGLDDGTVLGVVAAHPPSVAKYDGRVEAEARRALGKIRAAAEEESAWITEVADAARVHDGTLAGTLKTFRSWLHLPDPAPLYAAIAAIVANRAPGDPVWLLLVGPPGSGKTEILMALTGQPDVHVAATLTEPALLSGSPQRERAEGAKGGLLREIGEYGIIVCKDFGSVLSMHRDARAAVLSALREVYDGSWTRHVGTDGGRRLHWQGKVGLIAGCTPTIDNHAAVLAAMGERATLLRMPDTDADAQAKRGLAHVEHEGDMRSALAGAVHAVLEHVGDERTAVQLEGAEQTRMIHLATLAVRCRSAVERESYTHEIELIPEPEAPARLAQTLARLLAALSTIGAERAEAWRVVAKVALDSMPKLRRRGLEYAVDRPGSFTTTDLAEDLDHPTSTTRRALEDLTAHGLLARSKQGKGKADLWHATDWARDRWRATVPQKSFITQKEK
jgi:hypothetical protein